MAKMDAHQYPWFRAGEAARAAGKKIEQNPHHKGSAPWKFWREGWHFHGWELQLRDIG